MLQRKMRRALIAFVVLATLPACAAAGAAPDVALAVLAYEGRKLVASASTKGRFAERLIAAKDGTMRVEMVVEAPDDEGYSYLRMTRFKWVNGARVREPEVETYVALEGTRTDRCDAPNIGPNYVPEGFWMCVMPRLGVTPPAVTAARWPAVTRDMLDHLRALLEEVHPAAIRDDDPAFRAWLVDGHAQARALAANVRTPAQQTGVLRYYLAGFRDGHLLLDGPEGDAVRWAGWLPKFDGDGFVVAHVQSAWPVAVPPQGATVLECDGRPPLELLARDFAPWTDRRVELLAVREALATQLTIDSGAIPGRRMPARCKVAMPGGGARVYPLRYQSLGRGALRVLLDGAGGTPQRAQFALEDLGEGRHWARVPTFQLDADGLRRIDGVAVRLATISDAKLVVFDLRGNGGGNSALGEKLFDALTGGLEATPVQLARVPHARALWRVSPRTIAEIERGLRSDRFYRGVGHPSLQFRADYAARMRAALADGKPWVEQAGGAALTPALVRELGVTTQRFGGRIVILTDEACFSACLDFVDTLLLAPGTVHLGRTTAADTHYMDVGTYRIGPQVLVQSPRKVWLGRPRGNNEPHVPSRVFTGNIADDAAVRAWVLSVMESKATP